MLGIIPFKREHTIDFRCFKQSGTTRARVDFYIDEHLDCIIFLEIDEHQHKYGYEIGCDIARMSRILTSLTLAGNSLPILFIRYNPHSFKVDGKNRRVLKRDREKQLVKFIQEYKSNESRPIDIAYMYYDSDTVDGSVYPTLLDHEDYNEKMKECVRHVIK
jgi:hypothetical protein